MNPNQEVDLTLTRGDINVLLAGLDRAAMEICRDEHMNGTFRKAWLHELSAVKKKVAIADQRAAMADATPRHESPRIIVPFVAGRN